MSNFRLRVAGAALAGIALACTVYGTSTRGIVPDLHEGNFVASDDDQVCYELSMLGYIDEVTSEMRGFRIDPPESYADGFVDVTLSPDETSLEWASSGATVLAFIVKGGPSYHVYDYVGTGFDWDGALVAPKNRGDQVSQISHYNVCYAVPPGGDVDGCTPGYWRNHADRWLGAAPSDDFDVTFGVDAFDPDVTLGQAIWLGGGDVHALARHGTAGLLNAYGGVPNADGTVVQYAFTAEEVIEMVQAALADGGDVEGTKDQLAAANEAGCPLEGTRADPVPR
jgi:hypothetical protein